MAGSVTPEGAEQLVAVVTEGECRMLMRLARSWAAEGSWRGETPLPRVIGLQGTEGGLQGPWPLDGAGQEPGVPGAGTGGEAAADRAGEGSGSGSWI